MTEIQLGVLRALDESSNYWDASYRPRGSLERLRKKGLVRGDKKYGWALTDAGRAYLYSAGIKTLRGNSMSNFDYRVDRAGEN